MMLAGIRRVVAIAAAAVALSLGLTLSPSLTRDDRGAPTGLLAPAEQPKKGERGLALASDPSQVAHARTSAPVGQGGVTKKEMVRTGGTRAPTVDRELQSELEEYLRGEAGSFGVAVQHLDTGQTVLINADRAFLSASTYKVLVMYRVYQQMARGRLSADDLLTISEQDAVEGDPDGGLYAGQTVTVADALEVMIAASSNAAAHALTRLVGGWGSIEAAADELGMSQTDLRGGYFWTTPADMLTFLWALAEGRLVSAEASRRMVRLLQRQRVNDRIPALLPPGVVVAHKAGELPGVRNDVGIVYGPRGRYVVCVFSQRANVDRVARVIAQVSRRVYDRYAQ